MVRKLATMVSLLALVVGFAACGGSGDTDDNSETDVETGETADGTGQGCDEGESCDDGDPCTEDDTCAEGECGGTPKVCDDGLFCNGPEMCNADTGACESAGSPSMSDGVVCTIDECDEDKDEVTHTPDDVGCDDGDICTENYCHPEDGCQATFNEVPCDDDDLCTTEDACFEGKCNGKSVECDDGEWCNGQESCDAETGGCVTKDVPVVDDGVDCTIDECDEENDEVTNSPDDMLCDDGNQCTLDVCDLEAGCDSTNTEEACDDGDGCTLEDACLEGECLGVAKVCDDELFCTGEESCDSESGECVEGTPPVDDDEYDCTVEECDEEKDKIVHLPTDALCDDQDLCTIDICFPAAGGCMYEDVDCSDDVFCNGEEICQPADGCLPGPALVLDDGFDCTADSCDEENDVIAHVPDDLLCDDGLWCNGAELCNVDHGCQNGAAPVDDDEIGCTVEECDEEGDVIIHTPDNTLCDNGLWCDGFETCDALLDCQGGEAPVVDDQISCTNDSCDEENDQIVNEVDDSNCNDQQFCNGDEFCDAELDCQDGEAPVVEDEYECTLDSCDEEADQIVHLPEDTLCDDQNVCSDDVCLVDAGCENTANMVDCDDNDPCTEDDFCTEFECAGAPKDCADGQFCNGDEECDPDTGDCVPGLEIVLADDIDCTEDACDEELDEITHTPMNEDCDDQNPCTENTCDVDSGCLDTPLDIACEDDEACTDGDWCVEGMCEPGSWVCEDCTNEEDDNADDLIDCCDELCFEDAVCLAETSCGDEKDNDCDGLVDCEDDDCFADDFCKPKPGDGDLVITEIFQNPGGNDDGKEWFEIVNVSQETFDLNGLTVSDLGIDSFTVDMVLEVAPGEAVVFGPNGDVNTNGGVAIDFVYSGLALSNGDDELRLTWDEVVIDEIAWDGGPEFPDPDGATMQLHPNSVDATANDDGAAWCEGKVPFGDGELGTPGGDNTPCIEVVCDDDLDDDMNGLKDCDDPACQGIAGCGEILCSDEMDNDGDEFVDCADEDCTGADECIDSDDDGVPDVKDICPLGDDTVDENQNDLPDACEIDWAGSVWPIEDAGVSDGDNLTIYLQIHKAGVTDAPGPGEHIEALMKYKTALMPIFLTKTMVFNGDTGNNDEYKATIPSFDLVGGQTLTVEFVVEYVHPSFQGLGVEYIYTGDIKDQGENVAPLEYTINTSSEPPLPGDIIINEIMRDPDAVGDSVGEWFELVNKTAKSLQLAGLVISDDGGQTFTVESSVVVPPFQFAVFGKNADTNANGGADIDYVYPAGFQLSNGEDEIIVKSEGVLIDEVKYGAGWPSPVGSSIRLDKNFSNADSNDLLTSWCPSGNLMSGGDNGTPGEPNGTCP